MGDFFLVVVLHLLDLLGEGGDDFQQGVFQCG
jgi:hypothetical protein